MFFIVQARCTDPDTDPMCDEIGHRVIKKIPVENREMMRETLKRWREIGRVIDDISVVA
jgi:hypothetical protein